MAEYVHGGARYISYFPKLSTGKFLSVHAVIVGRKVSKIMPKKTGSLGRWSISTPNGGYNTLVGSGTSSAARPCMGWDRCARPE